MTRSPKTQARSCPTKKRPFATLAVAQASAAGLARRRKLQGNAIVTFLRAYVCACGSFHFGRTRDIDWSRVK